MPNKNISAGGPQGPSTALTRLSLGERPILKLSAFLDVLEARKSHFEKAVAKHLRPERLFRVAQTAVSKQPLLLRCTTESMLLSLMECGQLGLEPNGRQAALVPFKNGELSKKAGEPIYEAQFMPMYQGLIELATRSGRVGSIESVLVFEEDVFSVQLGTEKRILHTPSLEIDRDDPNTFVFVYAIARFRDGTPPMFEVMTRAQAEAIRARSRARDKGPWVTDTLEMHRKSPVRRLAKYLPQTPELQAAILIDDSIEQGRPIRLGDLDPTLGEPSLEPEETDPQAKVAEVEKEVQGDE